MPPFMTDAAWLANAQEAARATDDLTDALVRLVIAGQGTSGPNDGYEQTLFHHAETLGIDLHEALAAHFERKGRATFGAGECA